MSSVNDQRGHVRLINTARRNPSLMCLLITLASFYGWLFYLVFQTGGGS